MKENEKTLEGQYADWVTRRKAQSKEIHMPDSGLDVGLSRIDAMHHRSDEQEPTTSHGITLGSVDVVCVRGVEWLVIQTGPRDLQM